MRAGEFLRFFFVLVERPSSLLGIFFRGIDITKKQVTRRREGEEPCISIGWAT